MNIDYTESQLCKAFVREVHYLQQCNQFSAPFKLIHIANERLKTNNKHLDQHYTGHLISMGMILGVPDYLISYQHGYHAWIEMKKCSKSRVQPSQKAFKQHCESMNIPHLITWEIDKAIAFIRLHGETSKKINEILNSLETPIDRI